MFNGNGVLNLNGDHLDLSYRDPSKWPSFTPGGSIRSITFDFGDPKVGPVVQLGLVSSVPGESEHLDWAHSIDPPHFHGSDQFRVISGGEWNLTGKSLPAGSYAFQESGLRYQEHPGDAHTAWVMLVIGDKRGARPTLLLKADYETVINTGSANDRPVQKDEEYPHPAGPRGVAAIATTAGCCERGYLRGAFTDIPADKPLSAVFGDAEAGPAVHLLKALPNQTAVPASSYATERLLVVTTGSCRIGDSEYRAGDMRIQRAGDPMPAIVSGAEGLEATLVIADRRAQPSVLDGDTSAAPWMLDTAGLRPQATTVPSAS